MQCLLNYYSETMFCEQNTFLGFGLLFYIIDGRRFRLTTIPAREETA